MPATLIQGAYLLGSLALFGIVGLVVKPGVVAMAKTCGWCSGTGKVPFGFTKITCPRCLGTGTVGDD